MRGLIVFVVFFLIFLVSSEVIPALLFPGSVVCLLFGVSSNVSFVCAVVNGLFYGFVVWVVFCLVFRWVERSVSGNGEGGGKKKG